MYCLKDIFEIDDDVFFFLKLSFVQFGLNNVYNCVKNSSLFPIVINIELKQAISQNNHCCLRIRNIIV